MAKGESERSVQTRRLTLSQEEIDVGTALMQRALADIPFVTGFTHEEGVAIQSLMRKMVGPT